MPLLLFKLNLNREFWRISLLASELPNDKKPAASIDIPVCSEEKKQWRKMSMRHEEGELLLVDAASGQFLMIVSVPAGVTRAQFIRVGIHEGERVQCLERLPGGTVVLKKNRQQIAVGHQLAEKISVVPVEEGERP